MVERPRSNGKEELFDPDKLHGILKRKEKGNGNGSSSKDLQSEIRRAIEEARGSETIQYESFSEVSEPEENDSDRNTFSGTISVTDLLEDQFVGDGRRPKDKKLGQKRNRHGNGKKRRFGQFRNKFS